MILAVSRIIPIGSALRVVEDIFGDRLMLCYKLIKTSDKYNRGRVAQG